MEMGTEAELASKKRWRDKNKERIREYNAEYNKKYREDNPEKMRLYRKRYFNKRKNFLRSLKEGRPCSICGGFFPHVALDWHHREPSQKEFSIAQLWNQSEEALLKEIEKCDIVCANCHRVIHYSENS